MDSTTPTPHSTPAHDEPLHVSNEQGMAVLTDTLNLLGQGLPNAGEASGLQELERWQAVLEASTRPGLAKIHQEIEVLRQQLTSPDTQAHELAETLASLGAETQKAGEEAANNYTEPLHQLSRTLMKASNLLSR